jgi:hypothetical protein
MLAYKPQLAVLVPFALIAGREWRALAAAVISEIALALVSAGLLGLGPWVAFLHKMAQPAGVVASSSSNWQAVPSVMTLARSLGLDAAVSAGLHWAVAAIAAAGALWIWFKTTDVRYRVGALASAMLIVTPYLRSYDLALLILPALALLPRDHAKTRRVAWAVIITAWSIPAVMTLTLLPVQYGALVTLAVMGLILWRFRAQERPVGD